MITRIRGVAEMARTKRERLGPGTTWKEEEKGANTVVPKIF